MISEKSASRGIESKTRIDVNNGRERHVDAFFYGLYVDPVILREKGGVDRNPRAACVADRRLYVRRNATLLREPGATALGIIYELTHEEIEALYRDLPAYRPEAVIAVTRDGQRIAALCMTLIDPPDFGFDNPAYLTRLREALAAIGHPVSEVDRWLADAPD